MQNPREPKLSNIVSLSDYRSHAREKAQLSPLEARVAELEVQLFDACREIKELTGTLNKLLRLIKGRGLR